jgi:DNA-binding transcriptional LysR family regulator
MEMHEVRYFLAACETMNFHRAASTRNVTQSALTRATKKLEPPGVSTADRHVHPVEPLAVRLTLAGQF